MPKLCCFLDPEGSFAERELDELCPTCGRPYGFPIFDAPERIGDFEVVETRPRGFYSATYVVSAPPFGDPALLKVAPTAIYKYFEHKDFESECRLHRRVAEGTDHVVKIRDFFNADVTFGDVTIPCHVAHLDFEDGPRLDEILAGREPTQVMTLAQIAIDLLHVLAEFEAKGLHHNDLQASNIIVKRLAAGQRRLDAVDESVRTMAVDLGSVSDESHEDPNSHHLSDLRSVAGHLVQFVSRLLDDPDNISDLDFRLARALEDHAWLLAPDTALHNVPPFEQMADAVRRAVERVTAPWREPLTLRRFNYYDNIQSLEAWHVPKLLVDPDDEWVPQMTGPGPKLLKGMRGCGKTILLRALELHARLTPVGGEGDADALERVRSDGFIGLYFPSLKLMDKPGAPSAAVAKPYVRLFVAYALQALRAVHHLRDVAPDEVVHGFQRGMGETVETFVEGADGLADAPGEYELERRLVDLQVDLGRDEPRYKLTGLPSEVFPHLAGAVRRCSPMWANFRVLFLLDDVSTRYLLEDRIKDLFSNLLFQDPSCAFKLTTEGQTFEAILRSPGRIEQAMRGRDFTTFDLGAAVNAKLSEPGRAGQQFIERILARRAEYVTLHPESAPRHKATPAEILGDEDMEKMAGQIASLDKTARERKSVYHGITALTKVCVGDISDVIAIYDDILAAAPAGRSLPVPKDVQSRLYQEHCSGRLLDLQRRDTQNNTKLSMYARGFAEASYELLMQSYRNPQGRNGAEPRRRRLRQYTKLYVRITSGDTDAQFARLRDLIDAGVFVLEGGTDKPRAKTRDSDPTQQFVLSFRKLYGLSNFIGIADSDRFELSGSRLEEWLDHPERCRDILLEHLLRGDADGAAADEDDVDEALIDDVLADLPDAAAGQAPDAAWVQEDLFEPPAREPLFELSPRARVPVAVEVTPDDSLLSGLDGLVVGLGFEECTLHSAGRAVDTIRPAQAVVLDYGPGGGGGGGDDDDGRGAEVARLVGDAAGHVTRVAYADVVSGGLTLPEGRWAVDVTGLAKPALFGAVRSALLTAGEVVVVHTDAAVTWPREDELQEILTAHAAADPDALWAALQKVYVGEEPPYTVESLLIGDSDETRERVLSAAASPKHARLLHLLDDRDYQREEIVVTSQEGARGQVARLAADVAARHAPARVHRIDGDDVAAMIALLGEQHALWYTDRGCNVELGLTGSKLHAVACAAVSAALKFSRCWYVRPGSFDPARFTEGVGETRWVHLALER